MKKSLLRMLSLALLVLLGTNGVWAETGSETNPTSSTKNEDLQCQSFTIPGTYIPSGSGKKCGTMPNNGLKLRTNQKDNTLQFKVNKEGGYTITSIEFDGYANDAGKDASLTGIKIIKVEVDGQEVTNYTGGEFPVSGEKTSATFSISGIEATDSVTFTFDNSNVTKTSQIVTCWTVGWSRPDATQPTITVSPTTVNLVPGATYTLTSKIDPTTFAEACSSMSSDEQVATVADGVVTAVGPGTATVSLAWNDNTEVAGSAVVTVADFNATQYDVKTYDFASMPDTELTISETAVGDIWNEGNNKVNAVYYCTNEGLTDIALQAVAGPTGKGWSIVAEKGLFLGSGAGRCAAVGNLKAGQIVEIIYSGTRFATGSKDDAVRKDDGALKTALNEGVGRAIYQMTEDGLLGFELNTGEAVSKINIYSEKTAAEPTPILTLQGTVGAEVSLTFGVYDAEDEFSVDFGDSELKTAKVGVNNAGPVDPETGQTAGATVFTGTVAGDGTIKVYGNNDIWYFISSGAMPTTLDQEKLMNVVQMSITGASEESIVLPAYPKMTQFSFNNSPIKSLDVSNVTTLTSLNVINTSVAATDMMLESIDLSKNTSLETIVLGGTFYKKGVLKSVDLSNNTALKQIVIANQELESIVLPEGANLTSGITVSMNKLTALDLSKLEAFKNIEATDNQLEAIDLSKLVAGSNVKLQNNSLTTLSVPVSVADFDASNNKLTAVTIENATKSCKLENNMLTLATIPAQPAGLSTASKTKKFTYAPQAALEVPETVSKLDLSTQLTVAKGELNSNAIGTEGEEGYAAAYESWLTGATTFTVKTVGETPATLVEGTDYTIADGIITFLKEQTEKVYVEMTNTALPKFTEAAPFKTTEFNVTLPKPILTLNAPANSEVSLTLGVYDTEDEYTVDFGDGTPQTKKVGVNNAGPVDPETGQTTGATVFTGTVGSDGTINVYGINDIWYLISSGAMPTTLDQEKLMNVVQMSITGANVESVVLPGYTRMTQFSFNNSPLKSLDVSNVGTLTNLNVCNTTVATMDMMLESIDLSKNTNLENLVLGGTFYRKGILKTIDLSNNTALKQIVVANQELESIILPEGAELTNGLNVAMNNLTVLDLSKLGSLKTLNAYTNQIESLDLSKLTEGSDLYIKENKLTELNVPVSVVNLEAQNNQLTSATIVNATKSCKLEDNAFTLATLPAQPAGLSTASKTKKFTYAPQAAYEVEENVTELDLTSQLTVAQGELNSADYATYLTGTTTYSFVTAGGTALVEGTDYEVTEPGKFKFLTEQAEKVHGVMANDAFPKFTGANAYVTTEFTVVPDTATGISTVGTAQQSGKFYNLQGVEVAAPVKGFYIHNGKKVVIK